MEGKPQGNIIFNVFEIVDCPAKSPGGFVKRQDSHIPQTDPLSFQFFINILEIDVLGSSRPEEA